MNEHETAHAERRATLIELLDRWKDFFEEPGGEARPLDENAAEQPQTLKDFTAFSAMGREATPMELRRCVELCARMAAAHHRHLMAYTARAEWRIVRGFEMQRVGGKYVPRIDSVTKQPIVDPDPKKMRRERVVPRWVNPRMVDRALDFVLGVWDRRVPLELPLGVTKGLREYVNPETGEVGWTQAA